MSRKISEGKGQTRNVSAEEHRAAKKATQARRRTRGPATTNIVPLFTALRNDRQTAREETEAVRLAAREEHAALARTLLSPQLKGLAAEVATEILLEWPAVEYDRHRESRLQAAIQQVIEGLPEESRRCHRDVALGKSCAREALQAAYEQLKAARRQPAS